MTNRKEKLVALETKQAERAEKERLALKKKQEEERKKELELKKEAEQYKMRMERQKKRREAAQALEGRDPQKALALVREIFETMTPKEKKAPGTAEEEKSGGEKDGDGKELADNKIKEEEISPPPLSEKERAQLLVIKGTALHALGRTQEAIEAYGQAVKADSTLRNARINLGKLLFMERRYEEALQQWELELADGYRSSELLFLIGQALYELSYAQKDPVKLEAARIAVKEAFVIRSDDPKIRKWLAILEFETERYDEAIRLFTLILKKNPLDPYYLEMLANCYLQVKDYKKAIDQLEIVARIKKPLTKSFCITLGDLYATVGLPSEAADWFMRAYKKKDSAPSRDRFYIGRLLMNAGRTDEALAWLTSLTEKDEEYLQAVSGAAQICLDRDDQEKALHYLSIARRLNPSDGFSHLTAGDLSLERKELDKALNAYAKAAALPDTKAEGLAGVAEVHYVKGDLSAAVSYYQKALAVSPDAKKYDIALKQIQRELTIKQSRTQ